MQRWTSLSEDIWSVYYNIIMFHKLVICNKLVKFSLQHHLTEESVFLLPLWSAATYCRPHPTNGQHNNEKANYHHVQNAPFCNTKKIFNTNIKYYYRCPQNALFCKTCKYSTQISSSTMITGFCQWKLLYFLFKFTLFCTD